MRTIKFRGQTNSGKWVYGSLIDDGVELVIIREMYVRPHLAQEWQVNPYTVGQFTGELDRNGKEIYEGDFFKLGSDKDIYEVRFEHGCFLAYKKDKQFGLVGELKNIFLLIIGNIHEQKEEQK
jgi:hypothetical protein